MRLHGDACLTPDWTLMRRRAEHSLDPPGGCERGWVLGTDLLSVARPLRHWRNDERPVVGAWDRAGSYPELLSRPDRQLHQLRSNSD